MQASTFSAKGQSMEPVYRKQHKNSRRNFDYGRMLGSIRFSQCALKSAYAGLPAELRSSDLNTRLLYLLRQITVFKEELEIIYKRVREKEKREKENKDG